MASSFLTAGLGVGGGSVTLPVSIANGGTGQTTANAALNALQVLALAQTSTVTLSDNITNTAPIEFVLKHTSSGTTAASFGLGEAVDLQSAAGTLRRVITDVTTLAVATDAAEEARRDLSIMAAGALAPHTRHAWIGGSSSNPALWFGATGSLYGIARASNQIQIFTGNALALNVTTNQILASYDFLISAKRFMGARSASTTPVATTVTLPTDGNAFPMSAGTGTLNSIVSTGWQAGSEIILECASGITITNNTAGTGATILTNTGASIVTSFTRAIKLYYNGTNWIVTG